MLIETVQVRVGQTTYEDADICRIDGVVLTFTSKLDGLRHARITTTKPWIIFRILKLSCGHDLNNYYETDRDMDGIETGCGLCSPQKYKDSKARFPYA